MASLPICCCQLSGQEGEILEQQQNCLLHSCPLLRLPFGTRAVAQGTGVLLGSPTILCRDRPDLLEAAGAAPWHFRCSGTVSRWRLLWIHSEGELCVLEPLITGFPLYHNHGPQTREKPRLFTEGEGYKVENPSLTSQAGQVLTWYLGEVCGWAKGGLGGQPSWGSPLP